MNGTKDFALEQELSIEAENQKVTHCVARKQHECSVSRGFPWETAVAILMLRHAMKTETLN